MSHITQRQASASEKEQSQGWELWESGETDSFEYTYDQDVQFVVQSGKAVIHSTTHEPVAISAGNHVTIRKGVEAKWAISEPIVNRYQYL
ncbi:cupin domain-containing protein [Pseudomonas citri]|uniref:cupin domain-containing protein n=1 Tax=Pseudomonas citri TaxID=2978349 RepID=UPI0021B6984C|nr:cupin domain-containing protein [Pseudomonas citri]